MTKKGDIMGKTAIVQRDRQTYAITPHTPAGLVDSALLRKVADVADKYRLQKIKLTSAQRIILIGFDEADIDTAWAELGTPHGSSSGLRVRSVKICPGTDCCKRGLRDSTAVGLEIDRRFHGREMPWKIKLGISGCPNDCAETCIKDIGLIGTPRGWHLTIGGNGGSQPRLSRRVLEYIPDDQQALAAVERLVDWISAAGRKCRFGKLLEEVGIETLRQVAAGEESGG